MANASCARWKTVGLFSMVCFLMDFQAHLPDIPNGRQTAQVSLTTHLPRLRYFQNFRLEAYAFQTRWQISQIISRLP
jgi:hypothetical protein